MSSCKNFSFVCTFIAKGHFFDEHVYFVCTKITTEISFLYFLAGENVISNWETEIAKALWNQGIYRRALDCFQMLKLKSGGFIASETGNEFAKGFFSAYPLAAHHPQRHRRQTHRHPHPRLDHHREIKDYRQPLAVFIRNQLQGFRALPQQAGTQLQFTLTWAELSTHRPWRH